MGRFGHTFISLNPWTTIAIGLALLNQVTRRSKLWISNLTIEPRAPYQHHWFTYRCLPTDCTWATSTTASWFSHHYLVACGNTNANNGRKGNKAFTYVACHDSSRVADHNSSEVRAVTHSLWAVANEHTATRLSVCSQNREKIKFMLTHYFSSHVLL